MLLGPQVVLAKIKNIDGLKVAPDGTVTSITKPPETITEEIFSAFMNFPSRVAAKDILTNQAAQAKEVKGQIESGWLQIENEKAGLHAAIENLMLGFITTNESLKITSQNPAVTKILGISEAGSWTIAELQNNIGNQFYFPIECNRAMESKLPLPPIDVSIGSKQIRFYISPIILVGKQIEVAGVTIILEAFSAPQAPVTGAGAGTAPSPA